MAKKDGKQSGASDKSCWDCNDDPSDKIKQMFVDIGQSRRIRMGQKPALRPVFTKTHGIAHGRFEIDPTLPKEFRVGVFAMDSFPLWVRFSSDAQPTDTDAGKTCGIGIKLFGVKGDKLLGDGDTQDFILQNHDVFFVDTAKDMCEFTKAGVIYGDYPGYIKEHPVTDQVLKEMAKVELSVLTATYWSVLPYAFGPDRFVKYKLEPETPADGVPDTGNPNYLAADLAQRLAQGEARFRFMVQVRTDGMPLDQATVRWSEADSRPVHVATLVLPRQDIRARGQAEYGENLAFNPWHALAEHAPQGSISEARKIAYSASGKERRDANGVPTREPGAAKPDEAIPDITDNCIVRAAIHPAIGICRVGNSEYDYFLGPEVTDPLAEPPGFYRDAKGALKRQGARFRIYGFNAEGRAVAELTPANAKIKWTVHLANKKAAWYAFELAQDIPEAASAPVQMLRNMNVSDRSSLVIDPGPRTISGSDQHGGPAHTFDTGKFMGRSVYLGELRTDEEGRLIVFGGRGKSASVDNLRAITFANNEGWYDDISDGPVTAEVEFNGQRLSVTPGWVVVAPPNYAPLQKSVRTMWDLMRDVAINDDRLRLVRPARPSFEHDIRPLFERLSRLQWVNAGFAASFGWRAPNDFATPEWVARLSQPTPTDGETRSLIAAQFRVPDRDVGSPVPWPWTYGDAMNVPMPQTPRAYTALTPTQLAFLQQWAAGDFDADYDPAHQPPRRIDQLSIAEQPDMLDKAALEFCLAEAFHPGCEMTWVMRTPSLYMAPFRIRHAPAGATEPFYGASYNSDLATRYGPLGAQYPGGLTRWMALPWQTDTASCRSAYPQPYAPFLATFWPARVPNQVLSKDNYDIVMDKKKPVAERLAAFALRADWLRPLGPPPYIDQINKFAGDIAQMGVVEVREGPGDAPFPAVMEVEDVPPPKAPTPLTARTARAQGPALGSGGHHGASEDLSGIEKVRRFPHGLR